MFKYYGARGVSVCDEWTKDADAYIDWALANGFKKNSGLQVDREDNDGPYSPENCRIVTTIVNANNKSNNFIVAAFGETKTVAEWTRDNRCAVSYGTLWERLRSHRDTPEVSIASPAWRRAPSD